MAEKRKNTLSREAQELQPIWFGQHGSQLALWPLITSWSPSQAQSLGVATRMLRVMREGSIMPVKVRGIILLTIPMIIG